MKLNEVELLAKLISKAVQKIYFVRMFVRMYPNLWYRSVAKPDNVESRGLRHFVGNCVLQKSYISDFEKFKARSH